MNSNVEVAEVVSVSYKDDNVEGLWQINCRFLNDKNAYRKDYAPIIARPIDSTFKQIPLPGELVLVLKATSNIASKNINIQEYYYLQTLNVQSSTHHNGIPTVGDVESGGASSTDYQTSTSATNKNSKNNNALGNFTENDEIRPLQPYEGDTLIEGRHGQSIRMGSTVTEGKDKYAISETHWEVGSSDHGDPITVIRNGQKSVFSTKPEKNQYISENIDYDAASIYLTNGQLVPLTRASEDLIAHDEFGFEKSKYEGNQVIIASDRLIFNSRNKETFIFSGGGIALSSPLGITIDSSGQGINMASTVINLGNKAKDAGEPVPMAIELEKVLREILNYIDALAQAMQTHIHPTGVGPSGPMTKATDAGKPKFTNPKDVNVILTPAPGLSDGVKSGVGKTEKRLSDIESKLVFLLKDPDYTSSKKPSDLKKNR